MNGNKGLTWGIGGMIGGVVVRITLVSIYGWTLLNATFWLGFGLIVGALSGAVSYAIYQIIQGLLLSRRQAG